jgi:O-antigen/teichoic acid export membrane protein
LVALPVLSLGVVLEIGSYQYISHSLLYFIARAGNGVLAIATLAIFSRLLSPAEYGIYALGMATATVVSAILFQWINAAVGRFYPMHLDDPSKVMLVVAKGFFIAIALTASVFTGGFIFRDLIEVNLSLLAIIFFITICLAFHNLALQVANVRNEPHLYGLLSWAKLSGTLLGGSILIYIGGGAQAALIGVIFGIFFSIVAFGRRLARQMRVGATDHRLSLDMLRYGLPLAISYIAIVIVDVSDRFMIGNLLGVTSVGPYAVAYDFIQQVIGPAMNVLYLAAFSSLVRIYEKEGNEAARMQLHMLGAKIVTLGLPVTLGVGFFSENIANLIFGAEYRQTAVEVMPLLAFAVFISAFKCYYLDSVMQLRRSTKCLAYSAIIMAGVNISLNLILLPSFGVMGAAWATFIAFLTGAIVSWIQANRLFDMPKLKNIFFKIFIANLAMLLVWQVLPESKTIWVLLKLFIGVLTYICLGVLLNIDGFRSNLERLLLHWRMRPPF